MEKLETFLKDYDGAQYVYMPKFMKRRVDALKKIQLEHINLMHKYHLEVHELELKYEKLYQPLYEKRAKIVSGEYEPSDQECQLPADIAEDEFNGDQENQDETNPVGLTGEEEAQLKKTVKGLPGFWLGCLNSTYNFNDSIEEHDRPILKHLKDLQLSYGQQDDYLTYKLDFLFNDNPYFTNKVLTKTYYLRMKPDEKDPFSYEGYEVCKSEGCEIEWNPGKDTTVKTVTVKQKNKNDGRIREKQKEVERDSFFHFFKPPESPNPDEDEDLEDELGALMAVDFEIGEALRQAIIPKAALYYAGYMMEEDDDDDDDDGADSYESDFADSYQDGSESESNNESNDSLGYDKRKLLASKKNKASPNSKKEA